MAYMFQAVDEDEASATVDTGNVTQESTELRRGAQAVFAGCVALAIFQPLLVAPAAFGCIASGVIILATKPTADCQQEIDREIKRRRFGCAWLWWGVMAAIIVGAAYVGFAGGAVVYMGMRGIR